MKTMENTNRGIYVRRLDKKGRFYIDNEVIDKGYLKPLGKGWLIYTTLARHANAKSQLCFLSYETIMKESGISNRNRIRKYISTLENLNMIVIKREIGKRCNVYYLLDSSQWRSPTSIASDTDKAVSKTIKEEYQNHRSGSITGDTLNELKNSTNEINIINKDSVKEARKLLSERFKP